MRDHQPIILEEFNGLWQRGDEESAPIDHFPDCNNIIFFESGFETRPGIDTFIAQGNVLRMYNYGMQEGETLLILTESGDLYHALLDGSDTIYGPILSIADMDDFAFYSYNGRAYITPFKTYTKDTGETYQKGLEDHGLYVYLGEGDAARLAGGDPPTNGGDSPLVAYVNFTEGVVTEGIHIIGISASDGVDESGGLGPEGVAVVFSPEHTQINLNNIPVGGVGITERKIYMTRAIAVEDWNPVGDIRFNYTFYFVKTISDNTTVNTIINVADADLTVAFSPGGLSTLTNSPMFLVNGEADGYCDLGLHVVGVVYETDTGYLTSPGPEFFAVQTYIDETKGIHVYNIPTSPDSFVVKRHLVSTVALNAWDGNNRADAFAAQLFFIPSGTIEDNTTTDVVVSYYDSELIEDASYLVDNFAHPPGGVGLTTYHGRLVSWGSFSDESLFYFSHPGEPEAVDQIDGYVIFPLDGRPATNGQEFRDVFYLFKQTKTRAVADNGDYPSTWELTLIDNGLGASVHGVCHVLDSDGVNVNYFLIVDWSGIMVFNGQYMWPELTWKIEDLWRGLDRDSFANIQILNDSIEHMIYITMPNRQMLMGDYDNDLDSKGIKWTPWTFDINTTTIAIIETNALLIGSNALAPSSLLVL